MDGSGRPIAGPSVWVEGAAAALRRQEGQTLLEYAAIIGFLGMATIAALWALGPAIGDAFEVVTDAITGVSF